MRTASCLALAGLVLTACATRPNRTEPKWAVGPAERAAMTLRMAEAQIGSPGEGCGEAEMARAKNLVNVLERELYDAGFEIEQKDENVADAVDVTLRVDPTDCSESLRGHLGLRVNKGDSELLDVEERDVVFSNLRVGANVLVDRILASDALLAKPPMHAMTSTTSTTS